MHETVTKLIRATLSVRPTPGSGPRAATAIGTATVAWGMPRAKVRMNAVQNGGTPASHEPSAAHAQRSRSAGETLGA